MENATLYDRSDDSQFKDNVDYITELKQYISRKTSVLDIGCGTGRFTNDVLRKSLPQDAEVYAIDKSKNMIEFASEKFDTSGILFYNLSITDILPDSWKSKFDLVTMFYCFHWIAARNLALKHIFDILKSDGMLCFQYPILHPIFSSYKVLRKNPVWSELIDKFVHIPVDNEALDPVNDLKKMLEKIGFKDIAVEMREKIYVFDSIYDFEDFFIAVNPFLFQVPPNKGFELFTQQRKYIMNCPEVKMLIDSKNSDILHAKVETKYSIIVCSCKKP